MRIEEVLQIFSFLPEIHAVGGCVRDFIMGKEPVDFDLATAAPPDYIIELCEKRNIRTIPTGVKYGTVTALVGPHSFEITTFRNDHNSDGRHTDVMFVPGIRDDLSRRDFTLNAMALDKDMNLIDPYGGRNDIANGIIKTVGIPRLRFTEDYLRIIRAARFSARFGFTIDTGTFNCMRINANLVLPNVSVERIKMEFDKAFESPNAGEFFSILYEIGFIDEYLPEYAKSAMLIQNPEYHPEGSVKEHIRECLNRHGSWPVLLHDIGKPATAKYDDRGWFTFYGHDKAGADIIPGIAKRLKLSNEEAKECLVAAKYHMRVYTVKRPAKVRRLALEIEGFEDLLETVTIADNHSEVFPELPQIPKWPTGEEIAQVIGCTMPNKLIGIGKKKIIEHWIATGNVELNVVKGVKLTENKIQEGFSSKNIQEIIDGLQLPYNAKVMVILRGVPGSGKSTLAKTLAPELRATICSADDFFIQDGKYVYDPNKIEQAHVSCKDRTFYLLANGLNVIIDNTNTRLFEMRDYVKMAQDEGYYIRMLETGFPGKSIHGVPDEKVQAMKNRWEEFTSIEDILNSKAPWEEKKEVA